MKDFSFLHMADLHLGSPFRGLTIDDPQAATRFAQAIRDTFSVLVTRAISEGVDFVVIAGDVYDGEWRDASIGLFFNREMARLDRAGIPVFMVKGNHDAASVVTRSVTLPRSVETFGVSQARTRTLEHLGVALHGQSYRDREAPDNLACDYPAAKSGYFNIGVLHTSLAGYAGHDPYAPCSEADLVAKGYDYWALGHIHQPQVVRERPPIVFSGNIQGRSVRETGPRGAMHVRVAGGEPQLTPWWMDRVRWSVATLDASSLEGFADIAPAVERLVAEAAEGLGERALALRLRIEGKTTLHGELLRRADEVRAEAQAAADRAGGEVWLEKVRLATNAPAAADPAGEADLATLRAALAEVRRDPRTEEGFDADLAALTAKLPGEAGLDVEPDALLAEAEALLGARLGNDAS